MNEQDVFELTVAPVGPNNPRNSEGAIIQLEDGQLLLGWTEWYAGDGADHAPARLVGKISSDGGRTWGEKYTLVENDGGCNVMEVNFLRMKSGDRPEASDGPPIAPGSYPGLLLIGLLSAVCSSRIVYPVLPGRILPSACY